MFEVEVRTVTRPLYEKQIAKFKYQFKYGSCPFFKYVFICKGRKKKTIIKMFPIPITVKNPELITPTS